MMCFESFQYKMLLLRCKCINGSFIGVVAHVVDVIRGWSNVFLSGIYEYKHIYTHAHHVLSIDRFFNNNMHIYNSHNVFTLSSYLCSFASSYAS